MELKLYVVELMLPDDKPNVAITVEATDEKELYDKVEKLYPGSLILSQIPKDDNNSSTFWHLGSEM
jgi:hypothetical protein